MCGTIALITAPKTSPGCNPDHSACWPRNTLGQFGNLSEMPGDHRWWSCDKNKHLRTASHPHLKWKIGNFMQGKKQRLNRLAGSHRCSVKTHDKTAFPPHTSLSTRARRCQNPCRCENIIQTQQGSSFPLIRKSLRDKDTEFVQSFAGESSAHGNKKWFLQPNST